jgi:hypothetical protein
VRNPRNQREWREAVEAAHSLMCLDAARQYGLVEGGPEIDVGRCIEILEDGRALGIVPLGSIAGQ